MSAAYDDEPALHAASSGDNVAPAPDTDPALSAEAAAEAAAEAGSAASAEADLNTIRKAALGNYHAALAARGASAVKTETQRLTTTAAMFSTRTPCAPVSRSGYAAEERRTVAADFIAPSGWCAADADAGLPAAMLPAGLGPAGPVRDEFTSLLRRGVRRVLLQRQLSMEDALFLAEVLAPGSGADIAELSLKGVLNDTLPQPPVPPALLAAEEERLRAEVAAGAPAGGEDEEDAEAAAADAASERLQVLLEKARIEFTDFDEGVAALARFRLNKLVTVTRALGGNRTVRFLDMSRNRIGARKDDGRASTFALRRIATLLDETKALRNVDVSGNLMGPVGIGIIAKAMTKNITIHTLNLSGNAAFEEPADDEDEAENAEHDPVFGEHYAGLEAIAEMLKKNKFLRTLSLRNNAIRADIDDTPDEDGSETPLGRLLEPFRKYNRLTTLDLAANSLGPAGARMVAAALAENTSVAVLDVSDNELGWTGLAHLAQLLRDNGAIETLSAQRNGLVPRQTRAGRRQTDKVAAAWAEVLGGGANSTLRCLDISGNRLGPDAAAILFGEFAASSVVELRADSVDLCGAEGPPRLAALSQIAAATARGDAPLEVLSVANNGLGPAGAAALADAVGRALRVLDVSRNAVGDAAFTQLMAALHGSALQELRAGHNGLTDCAPLADAAVQLAGLRVIDVRRNRIGEAAQAWGRLLAGIGILGGTVEELNLAGCQLGTRTAHMDALRDLCVRSRRPFARLDLLDNPCLSLDDVAELLRALEGNGSIRHFACSSAGEDRDALSVTARRLLEANTTLTDLDLCLPLDVDDEPLAALRAAIVRNSLNAQR